MARLATEALLNKVVNEHKRLGKLEEELRLYGDHDVADAVKRARKELTHSPVTSAINARGSKGFEA